MTANMARLARRDRSIKARRLASGALMVLAAIAPLAVDADARAVKKRRCAALQQQIDRLDSRLRAGYSVRQGEALRAKRRQLKDEYYNLRCGR
ncbi:MAG TPA: hypothetical protein P5528_10695 [Steroidobacteraceae bacterium]|nr:hypothetical protein [Steroidobacteraceae bacterium]HRX89901.1 hypothetical protein [Steroidobacteraceae bacterium]